MSLELGHRSRQEGLLDQARNLQLLFDALPLLSLLLLLGHGALELLGTLCNPSFEVLVELPDPEGKRHTQALIALARRRVNVVWAMLRDGTTFETRSAA
jgi:hypothetical protein